MVISIVLTLAGIISVFSLPIALYPEITPPEVVVSASYPGASAEVIAKTVGIPLEEEINGVEDMLLHEFFFGKLFLSADRYLQSRR